MNTTSYLRRSKPSGSDMIPPIPRPSSSSSFNDSYFSKPYVPLSSLPTPPLSHSRTNSRQQSPDIFSPSENLDPDLLGPAIYLTNLIPCSTSLTTPSIPLVHAILSRAALPLEILALAVCILDSLNSRFALQWRSNCPLQFLSLPAPFNSTSSSGGEIQHIDNIHPEIIVLAAMILAVKFLDDHQQSTKEYAEEWGNGIWSCEQVNYTQRVVLENLGYRLLPLWEEGIILEALEDMERAGNAWEPEIYDDQEDEDAENENLWDLREEFMGKMLRGKGDAVMGLGNQVTPAETPRCENCKGTSDIPGETMDGFGHSGAKEMMEFQYPKDESLTAVEPFPAFIPTYGV